ncbi:MAG: hypothetical protein AB1652_03035 [Bacillota bacterium]
MLKIKDRIILGVISGIVTGTPSKIINSMEYRANLTDVKYGHITSNLFLPKSEVDAPGAKILAALANHVNSSIVGVLITYLLSLTGRDQAMIKGLGVASFSWVIIYGTLSERLGLRRKSKRPLTHLLSFLDHVLFGALCGLFISKCGDDSLFPDPKMPNDKLQLRFLSQPRPIQSN